MSNNTTVQVRTYYGQVCVDYSRVKSFVTWHISCFLPSNFMKQHVNQK